MRVAWLKAGNLIFVLIRVVTSPTWNLAAVVVDCLVAASPVPYILHVLGVLLAWDAGFLFGRRKINTYFENPRVVMAGQDKGSWLIFAWFDFLKRGKCEENIVLAEFHFAEWWGFLRVERQRNLGSALGREKWRVWRKWGKYCEDRQRQGIVGE